MDHRSPSPEDTHERPLLRGYLHLGAAIAAVLGTIWLVVAAHADVAKQVSFVIYGLSSVILFGMSALYHIVTWPPKTRAVLRRLDHANIFLLIAGTYTPIVFNVLSGGWRVGILGTVWVLSLLGIGLAAPQLRLPRWVLVSLYLAVGWVALAAMPQITSILGVGALLIMIAAGVLYSLGAAAYALKKPNPWPKVFGYHEVFHLATVGANLLFFSLMLGYVVGFVRR